MRRSVSLTEKPQSTSREVLPSSMRVAFPRLPLPNRAKRILDVGPLLQRLLKALKDRFGSGAVIGITRRITNSDTCALFIPAQEDLAL